MCHWLGRTRCPFRRLLSKNAFVACEDVLSKDTSEASLWKTRWKPLPHLMSRACEGSFPSLLPKDPSEGSFWGSFRFLVHNNCPPLFVLFFLRYKIKSITLGDDTKINCNKHVSVILLLKNPSEWPFLSIFQLSQCLGFCTSAINRAIYFGNFLTLTYSLEGTTRSLSLFSSEGTFHCFVSSLSERPPSETTVAIGNRIVLFFPKYSFF